MLEKIQEMIVESLGVDAAKVTETASFKEDLGADSLDLFELVMALEDEYGVEIPTEELEKMVTVGDVVSLIRLTESVETVCNFLAGPVLPPLVKLSETPAQGRRGNYRGMPKEDKYENRDNKVTGNPVSDYTRRYGLGGGVPSGGGCF